MGRLIVGYLLVGVAVLVTAYVLWACLPAPGCIVGEAVKSWFLMALLPLLGGLFFILLGRSSKSADRG